VLITILGIIFNVILAAITKFSNGFLGGLGFMAAIYLFGAELYAYLYLKMMIMIIGIG